MLPRKCSDSQPATYSPCDRQGMQGQPGQSAKSLMSDLSEIFESSLCLSWLREMWRLEMRPRQVGLLVLLGQRARPVPPVLGQYAKRLIDLGSCQLWKACGQFQNIPVQCPAFILSRELQVSEEKVHRSSLMHTVHCCSILCSCHQT